MGMSVPVVLLAATLFRYAAGSYLEKVQPVTGVVAAVARRYGLSCITVLYGHRQTWQEEREIFLLTRSLSKEIQLLVLPSQQPHNQKTNVCVRKINVLLGWHSEPAGVFKKMSQQEPELFSTSHWVVFFRGNMTSQSFLANAYIPFNTALILATIRGSAVTLEEAYQVARDYPLRVVPYGRWSQAEFVAPAGLSKYTRRTDLEGYPIRASTKDDPPISKLLRSKLGDLTIGGYFGMVYYELGARTNFTPVYVESLDNSTGSALNGSWTGLLGMLQREEIDLGVGPLSFKSTVLDVARLTWPLLSSNYQIFFKQSGNVMEWNAIMKPFGRYVWLAMVLWVFIATVVMNRMYSIQCHYGKEDAVRQAEFSPINSFLAFFKALCQQGSTIVPESYSCRILYITSYLVSTILLTSYSASLISNLTVEEPLRPFDSLDTLYRDGSYKLIAIRRSTDYTYFSESRVPLLQQIYGSLMEKIPDKELPRGKEEGMETVCMKEKYALFITAAVTQLTARQFSEERGCRILSLRAPLDKVFLTVARRTGLPYAELFDYQLEAMATTGVLSKLRTQAWPLQRNPLRLEVLQVTIEQVVQVHCVLIVGALLSIMVLCLEKSLRLRHYGFTVFAVVVLLVIIINISFFLL